MNRDNPHRALTRRLLALLALLAVPALQAASLYDVEVIVFSRDSADVDDEVMGPASGDAGQAPGAFADGAFTALPSGAWRLNNISGGLSAARGYHVLFHRAWRQPGLDRNRARAYPVHVAGSRDRLDGTVTLTRERYLHLDADLVLTGGNGMTYRLDERRRLRSGELNYFDHPRFGLIARVTPYQPPDEAPAPEPADEGPAEDTGGGQEEEPAPAVDQLTR